MISHLNARTLTLLFFGLASAIPLAMCGTTLTIRLSELGLSKTLIGTLGLLHFPYSCRLFWGPIIDQRPPFVFSFFGWRKGWTILSLLSATLSIALLGWIDPLTSFWTFTVLLGAASFASGCVYMSGLAYELESLKEEEYPMGSACVNAGYRMGLLVAGAMALYAAALYGWMTAYFFASAVMLGGTLIVWLQPEPFKSETLRKERLTGEKRRLAIFYRGLIDPIANFWQRPDKYYILFFLFLYKLGDDLAHGYLPVFFLETGFSKEEIAVTVKLFGMGATFFGVFLGSFVAQSWGIVRSLLTFGALHGISFSLYTLLHNLGPLTSLLSLAVAVEHATSGMVVTVFIAYLWRIAAPRYAAMQYALFWSLLSCKHVILHSCGGWLSDQLSWPVFFTLTTLLFFPGLFALVSLHRRTFARA